MDKRLTNEPPGRALSIRDELVKQRQECMPVRFGSTGFVETGELTVRRMLRAMVKLSGVEIHQPYRDYSARISPIAMSS